MKLLTAFDQNYAEMAQLTSKADYCKKWGIDYIEARIPEDYDRPPAWYKIRLLLDTMKGSGEWLMWCDCDTVIMDEKKNAEDYCDIHESWEIDLQLGRDENGINTGVMFIRDCELMKQLFVLAYSKTEYLNHCWWEQLAIRDAIKEFNHCAAWENCTFNAHPSRYKEGDFLVHFAGVPNRLFAIKKWIREHGQSVSGSHIIGMNYKEENGKVILMDKRA